MKKIALSIFISFSIALSAQTAEEIIHQNLEKSGGIKNWKNLNSIILHGDALLSLEESFPMVIYHQRPYQKKVVFLVQGKELLNEGFDGKKAWTYNQLSGKNEVVPNYQPDAFDSDILDYAKKGFEANYLGQEQFEQKTCYKVELVKNTNRTTYCFSTDNYALLWEENQEEKMVYSDYKVFNGLRFATKIVGQPKAGGEYVIKFNSIQINPKIDEKQFKF
ncbi:MAG TPA: hypothetical protein VL022_03540 [Moheibacter sp.]|nr:hypothetical protein [Moheibacter sp.]